MRVPYYVGRMLDVITLLTTCHLLGKIFLSQDYFHLHFSYSLGGSSCFHITIGHFYLLCKLSILILCPFFNQSVSFFFISFKSFQYIKYNNTALLSALQVFVSNLSFINFLRQSFPYTKFKCLCSKHIHFLFPIFQVFCLVFNELSNILVVYIVS